MILYINKTSSNLETKVGKNTLHKKGVASRFHTLISLTILMKVCHEHIAYIVVKRIGLGDSELPL